MRKEMVRRARLARTAASIVSVFAVLALANPALAGDTPLISQNPVGAAIALSVEPPAIGYCRDKDAGRAMTCAIEECEADGGQSCAAALWCAVAGQAGVMSGYNVQLGAANLFATCGQFSPEGVEAVLRAKCEIDARNAECAMMSVWSLDGVREDKAPR